MRNATESGRERAAMFGMIWRVFGRGLGNYGGIWELCLDNELLNISSILGFH